MPLIPPQRRTWRGTVPIIDWLPRYRLGADGPSDVAAGVALAALLIPESMGYSSVAGVPPQVGLYAALGALVAYAIFGGVGVLVVGPASATAAVSASVVSQISDSNAVVLTSALAITSGLVLVVAGALRLGWIVNFISRPVLEAFIAGLCISIIVGQFGGLLGIDVEGESTAAKAWSVSRHLFDAHGLTVVFGVGAVCVMAVLERVAKRIPAAIVVVVLGIAAAYTVGLADRGVELVGAIPRGLPSFSVPSLSASDWIELLLAAGAMVLVGFSEGYAAAASTVDGTGQTVDADQELAASGVANIASGLVGGMAVNGSLSKSAASAAAGARSQVANLVSGVVLVATLLFLAPVVERLPEPVLAAVVIMAVIRSADPRKVFALWEVNRLDFFAGAVTFVLVLVWDTLPAMIVGVALSLAFVVRRVSFPDVVELGRFDGVYRRIERQDDAAAAEVELVDGAAILRFEGALIYANASRLGVATRTLLAEHPAVSHVVLDAEMLSDLDSSGAEALVALDDLLSSQGVELRLARIHARARRQVARSHLATRFEGRTFATLDAAVRDERDTRADRG